MKSQEARLRSAVEGLRKAAIVGPAKLARTTLVVNAAERSRFARQVISTKWFRQRFSMQRMAWSPTWRGDRITVLHELAHYLVPRETWAVPRSKGESWVRRETCWSFLLLVQHHLGREAAKALREAYVANGVKYRPRRLLTAAQKDSLRSRAFGKKPKRVLVAGATVPGRRKISFTDE